MMEKFQVPFKAYPGDEPYTFVSYAHLNRDIVFPLIKQLHDKGYRIWYDEGIDPGTEWAELIATHLKTASSMLLFITPQAIASFNVNDEIHFALNKKIPIVPIFMQDIELPDDLQLRLGRYLWVNYFRYEDDGAFLEQLMRSPHLKNCLGQGGQTIARETPDDRARRRAAMERANEAPGLDPKNAQAYYNRGFTHNEQGNYDAAIQDLTEAIRFDPNLASAYVSRGFAYHYRQDYDATIRDCTEAIRLDPRYAVAYNTRGSAYLLKGDYDTAIRDCTEGIRLDPKYAFAYNNRGYAYYSKGDYDAAIRDLTEAIRLDPKLTNAYTNRARVYRAKGDIKAAQRDEAEYKRLTN